MLLYIPDFPQCFGKDHWPKQMWKRDSGIWTMSVSWIFKIWSAVWQKYYLLLRLLLAWLLHPTVTFLPVFPSMVPSFTWLVSMEEVNDTAGVAFVLVFWSLLSLVPTVLLSLVWVNAAWFLHLGLAACGFSTCKSLVMLQPSRYIPKVLWAKLCRWRLWRQPLLGWVVVLFRSPRSSPGWRRQRCSPLCSTHTAPGALEAPGPWPRPRGSAFPEGRLQAARAKWTLTQFAASHMDFVTLPYVMNKLTCARNFTCQRVICCALM